MAALCGATVIGRWDFRTFDVAANERVPENSRNSAKLCSRGGILGSSVFCSGAARHHPIDHALLARNRVVEQSFLAMRKHFTRLVTFVGSLHWLTRTSLARSTQI